MVYNLINSNIVISRIFDQYNIDYTGFISRVPTWIYNALKILHTGAVLIPKIIPSTVTNYRCDIPPETEELVAVTYKGLKLPRIDSVNGNVTDDVSKMYHTTYKYQLNPEGYIVTTFETGDIKLYTKSFKTQLDVVLNVNFPLIPNDEELISGLMWYILRNLLYRGHNIPLLSLAANNPFLNPALAWEQSIKKIKNSLHSLDSDEMQAIMELNTSFLLDYDKNYNDIEQTYE